MQLFFELRQLAVAQLCHLIEIALSGELFNFEFELFNFFTHMLAALSLGFFGVPYFFKVSRFTTEFFNFFF